MTSHTSTGESDQIQLLIDHMKQYLSSKRIEKLEHVLNLRTKHITLVLEDIYQSQNASAAIRTAEGLGLQQVHIIENENKYKVNHKVMLGAEKWVDLVQFKAKGINNTDVCFNTLKNEGYSIVVTSPSPQEMALEELPVDKRIALVMGSELNGISEYALAHADKVIHIPMFGFTESFNISASAAICLNHLVNKVRSSSVQWQLTNEEKDALRLTWLRKMVKRSEVLEKEFLKSLP